MQRRCTIRVGVSAALLLAAGGTLGPPLQAGPPSDRRAAFAIGGDSRAGILDGTLFYAVAPRSEGDLRRADGPPFTVMVPLSVGPDGLLRVSIGIAGHAARPILDTGGGPGVVLSRRASRGIPLSGSLPVSLSGVQGKEDATEGIARSMTLGGLTLGGIDTVARKDDAGLDNSTLGTQAFERYRVMLDLAQKTLTLARGALPSGAPAGGEALSIPFRDQGGAILVPVHTLGRAFWAQLDSGSDANSLSLSAARLAAAKLPATESFSRVTSRKIGTGDSHRAFTLMGLKVPVPIALNTVREGLDFSTASMIGGSDIDNQVSPALRTPLGALLGMPFLRQFQRVIIDYPHHMLTLQYPEHDATTAAIGGVGLPLGLADARVRRRAWAGYRWRQVGNAWVEVPDDAVSRGSTPPPSKPPGASFEAAGSVQTCIVNGIHYTTLNGSSVTIGADGSVLVSPPTADTASDGPAARK